MGNPHIPHSTYHLPLHPMKLTQEQLAFIRQHGLTRCPPSPEIRPFWGYAHHGRGGPYFPTPTEGDILRAMTRFELAVWRPPMLGARPMSRARKNGNGKPRAH